jgi:predicted transposase YdaD
MVYHSNKFFLVLNEVGLSIYCQFEGTVKVDIVAYFRQLRPEYKSDAIRLR